MQVLLLAIFLKCLDLQQSLQESNKKPMVTLVYEPLCPYSKQFITEVLHPLYLDLGSFIELDFIPYGNVKKRQMENGTWTYICQHGIDECDISKLQACGLTKTHNQTQHMEYIYCIENLVNECTDIDKLAKCSSAIHTPKEEVLKCATSSEGRELFVALGSKQLSLAENYKGVPTVYVDHKNLHNYNTIRKTLCNMLNDKPERCSKNNDNKV